MVRALIVTPMARHFGRAIGSWHVAITALVEKYPSVEYDHWMIHNGLAVVSDHQSIIHEKYIDFRNRALQGKYDFMVCLEDDIVIPGDALIRLYDQWRLGSQVAYGVYCFRKQPTRWNIQSVMTETKGISFSTMHVDTIDNFMGQVIPTIGTGLGCTLIDTDVLAAIPFVRRGDAANDWYFSIDCVEAGIRQVAHFGVICGHMTTYPSPRIYWPDSSDKDNLYRVEFL